MNAKHVFPIVVLALVVAGAGCNKAGKLSEHSKLAPTSGPVELKSKWPAGERVVQNLDMKVKTELTIPGQPAPVLQNMTMGEKYALKVLKENPDGGHEVEMEFLSARMGMDMAGKSMVNYDSTKKSAADAADPVAGVFGKIIGSKIKFFLNASNDVDRVEGVDEMVNRMSAGGQASTVASFKSMFSEGYFKQMMSSSRFLPPKPVSPGDTWPVQLEFPMDPLGTLVMDFTFTFQSWEMHGQRNCARLEFDGSVKSRPGANPGAAGMTMAIQNGTTSGTSWFDPELGITIDTIMNQDMTINITVPKNPRAPNQPQTVTSKMNQVLNIKLDSVK
jgi:hypothetical protein